MKTIAILLTAISFVFSSAQAFAGDQSKKCQTVSSLPEAAEKGLQANIFQNASGRVTVIMMQAEKTPLTIRVTDSDQNTIFSESVVEDSARQHFDMSRTEAGKYTFTISRGGECFVKNVEVH